MPDSVNIIRNPCFAEGKAAPRSWVFNTAKKAASWRSGTPEHTDGPAGVTIICDDATERAFWSQVVVCKPGAYYRVDAVVTCNLNGADESAGFVLALEPVKDGQQAGKREVTPTLHQAAQPVTVRAIYQAPPGVRRLRVSVGLGYAKGTVCIREVRFMEILEPDEVSHVLAVPEPPNTLDAPRVVRDVWVCSKNATGRPITRLLAGCFGDRHVFPISPGELRPAAVEADAVLLPDSVPPSSIRSLTALIELATNGIVIISLPAFARLSRGSLSLKHVEQEDDPIFAKVTCANYATRGFALHDTFAYGWPGRTPGSFKHNQYRKTKSLQSFCEELGFEPLLVSMCNRDATSDRPICLYKATSGGGLFVLDIEPAEAEGSTFGEPTLALYLLLGMLGQPQTNLGQFVVPLRQGDQFAAVIREMAARFEHFTVHDADVPAEEVIQQLVTIGSEDRSYGPPLKPKPVILIRSGLTAGDVESVYGTLLWFKQLVRAEPFTCPYGHQLAAQYRLAWVPCVARCEGRNGWCRSGQPPAEPMAIEVEDARVAVLIDVVSRPVNRVRVVLPSVKSTYGRYATWLPQLTGVFGPGRYFSQSPPDGAGFSDCNQLAWRHTRHNLQVVAEAAAFDDDVYRDVMAGGGEVIRLEVPGNDAGFTSHSIEYTDLTATHLEHVIGLQYGLIAVNRRSSSVQLDGFPTTAPGQALIVDHQYLPLRAEASRTG